MKQPKPELRPCPFCGGRVIRVRGWNGLNFFKCLCHGCSAVMSFDNDYYNLHTDEAVNAYNKRTEDKQ